MTTPLGPQPSVSLSDSTVVLLGLLNATLMAGGMILQKINGLRAGNVFLSGWLILALCCFAPTFPIANKVFLMGGRMSLFVLMGAMTYVLTMLAGHFFFHESISLTKWAGAALIVLGVGAAAAN